MIDDSSNSLDIPLILLLAYSRGEITRRAVGEAIGRPVDFRELLVLLAERGLPLPQPVSSFGSPGSPGRVALREVLEELKSLKKPRN